MDVHNLQREKLKELEKCCSDVCRQLENDSSESSNCLGLLRRLCGLDSCGCPSYTPEQNLSLLLRLRWNSGTEHDLSVGVSILNNYNTLGHQVHCQTALERVLKQSLSATPSQEKQHFWKSLWNHTGLRNFSTNVLEDFIKHKTSYLEEDIFSYFEESLKEQGSHEQVMMNPKFERLIFWCSNSSVIFSVVTSVLNAWLQMITSSTEPCITAVTDMISSIKLQCVNNKRDFVSLYPREYHSIVSLLDISPQYFIDSNIAKDSCSVSLSTVVDLVVQQLKSKPVQIICLLTHFPEWSPYINR